MTHIAAKYLLQREIDTINKIIDQKIQKGIPYKREASIHRKLLSKLSSLEKKRSRLPLGFLFV